MSTEAKFRVGVLDIQGSVEEHFEMLKKIGAAAVLVKSKEDLDDVAGLIIPGGESTTISKLLERCGLDQEIRRRARRRQKPLVIWGTCAGAILLAKKIVGREVRTLSLMDIEIQRNAYGRQIDSFSTELKVPALGESEIPAVFIRAPVVLSVSREAHVMATCNRTPVMIRQQNVLATMFHPELTSDTRIHKYFLSLTAHYACR